MYMKDFYVNTLQRCSRNFRESSLPRKLFFAITVVQLTLLLFVSVYYTYRLQAKNNVHRTDWRYALSGKPRAVSGINTKTSLLHSQPSSQDENVYSLAKSMKANISIPKCPLVPPYLTGKYNIDKTEYDEKTLKRKLYFVQDGGAYKPSTCKPRHKVAIVIPYRNRKQHLRILLYNLHPFLQRQQLEYQIFVVELAPQIDFNRALCMNIGFLEARKRGYKCFIFHDVDMIPENDNNVYSCPENPRHMSVAIDKFGYELPYVGLFGGVTAMSEDQFTLVNGYSNKFFGWGGEDDDLYRRIRNLGISITRYTPDVSSYRMLKHVADSNLNNNRQRLLEGALSRWKEDGLNTIKYESLQVQRRPLYTYVLANINQDEWMYQPWTSASDKSSDSIDPALEEIVIDKAKYLLGKYTLGDDIITAITKEFRSLNSSSVSMKVVSGILTRLFPMKSAEPVVLPLVVQSSENESITNNQTRLVERDAPTLEVIPRGIQEPHEQAHNQTYSNQQTPPSQKRYPIQKEYRMENQTKEHSNRQDIWNFMSHQKIKKANPAWKRHVKHGSNPFLENQPKEEKLKSAQNEPVMQNFGMNGHKQKIQTLIDTLRAKNMKIAGVDEKSSKHTQFNRDHVLPIPVQQIDAEAHADTKIKTEQDKQTLTQNEQDKQTHTQDKTEQDKQTLAQHEPEQDKQTLTQHEPEQDKQTLTQHEPEQDKQTLTQHETEQDKQTLTQHEPEQDKQTLTQHEPEQDKQTLTQHEPEQDKQTLTQHEPEQDKQTLTQHEPEQDKQTLTQNEQEQDKQTLTQHEPEQDKQTLTQHKQNKINKHLLNMKQNKINKHLLNMNQNKINKHLLNITNLTQMNRTR
ncbi:uncharacterized protein [Argopecten irradians]|uniref:uncharacterized protein n=1 Tax=Argopecten irradians TaxID=31199 RepID=UPI003712F0A4